MNLGGPSSYKLPVVFAIAVHVLAALLLLSQWPSFDKKQLPPVPNFISASVIREQNQVIKKKDKKQIPKKKSKKSDELKRKKEAEKKKRLEKKKAEQKRKREVEKAKKLAQKKRLAAKKLAQKKKKEQAIKKAKEKAERQKREKAQWEQELLEQMALEEAQREQEEQKREEQRAKEAQEKEAIEAKRRAGIKADFSSQIKQLITGMWNYPHGVDPKLEVEVRVSVLPTGEVVNVQILKSSNKVALDKSVEKAIYAASPLPVPKDTLVFENEFRSFIMKFRPEDAVL